MLKEFTLKNGLRVATYSIPQMRSVYLLLSAKSGSIFDSKETCGLAHFMEHILFEGTPSFPEIESFTDHIESLAGRYNARTAKDFIEFQLSVPSHHLDHALKVAGEVFFEPIFPEPAIERERGAIMEEIYSRKDSLWYKNWQFFAKVRYKKDHPLLLDSGGTQESIMKLQREDLLRYWSQFFFPNNTYLVLVGNIDGKSIEKKIEENLGKYNGSGEFIGYPTITNKDFADGGVFIRTDKELNTCYVDFSFPTIGEDAPLSERVIQSVIRNILGGRSGSRLFRLLRLKRGLVYDVGISFSSIFSMGMADLYSQVNADKLEEVLKLIVLEMSDFIKNGPTEKEFAFAKDFFINRTMMQFDNPGSIGDWLMGDMLFEDTIYLPEDYAKIIGEVKYEEIKSFMKKYWDFSKLSLVIQGPLENSKANREKFEAIIADLK